MVASAGSDTKISLKIDIDEQLYRELAVANQKPVSIFLSEFITISYENGLLSPNLENIKNDVWDKGKMDQFLDYLFEAQKSRADIDQLLSLLAAYAKIGKIRPTTTELRTSLNQRNDIKKWNQELRISKSRLTIAAKNMQMPMKLFGTAYGKGDKRVHQINPECLSALVSRFEQYNIDEEMTLEYYLNVFYPDYI